MGTAREMLHRGHVTLPHTLWLACTRLVADPALDNLLHLHGRRVHAAKDGANGNPAEGSSGPRYIPTNNHAVICVYSEVLSGCLTSSSAASREERVT